MGLHTEAIESESRLKKTIGLAVKFIALVLFACLLGTQIYSPHPRIIKLAIALILFWMTIRSPLPKVVAVLAFILPFSAGTVLGPTSGLAIIMVFLVWMVRVATGGSSPVWKSPVSASLVALILIHALSFYNAPAGYQMDFALKKFGVLLSAALLFYLILNFATDEQGLKRLVWASMLSCAAIIVLSMIELFVPGWRVIPWFTLTGTRQYSQFGARWIGGPFRDGELLGEYMAISAPLQAYMLSRARSMPIKAFWGIMLLGSLSTALATMHRAPLLSLSIGIVYLIVLFRNRVKLHALALILILGVGSVLTLEFIMAEYTPTGSVIQRIQRTEFYGITPDSRRMPWQQAWERSFEHPWIGHGPYYDIGHPVPRYYAPHSTYLYYFYTVGIIGVVIFAWLMVNLIRMTLRYMSVRTGIATFSTDLLVVLHVQIVVFLIDGIKIDYQRSPIYFLMLWLVFGMCAACYRVAERRTAEVLEERRAGAPGGPANGAAKSRKG